MKLNHFRAVLLLGILVMNANSIWAQSTDRASVLGEIESLRSQLKIKEDEFLAPAPEDCATYAEFLGKKDAGLIRLLPRNTQREKSGLTLRGGGAYYSFARLTHEYGYGSDIQLEQEYLSVGFAGANYGWLANFGDIPLETLTPEASIVQPLAAYTPPTTLPGARIDQGRSMREGMMFGSIFYKARIPAKVNNTYLLRSINYDTSDVLVAFRVVRWDTDGSLILVWQMLKKYLVPQLEREKEVSKS